MGTLVKALFLPALLLGEFTVAESHKLSLADVSVNTCRDGEPIYCAPISYKGASMESAGGLRGPKPAAQFDEEYNNKHSISVPDVITAEVDSENTLPTGRILSVFRNVNTYVDGQGHTIAGIRTILTATTIVRNPSIQASLQIPNDDFFHVKIEGKPLILVNYYTMAEAVDELVPPYVRADRSFVPILMMIYVFDNSPSPSLDCDVLLQTDLWKKLNQRVADEAIMTINEKVRFKASHFTGPEDQVHDEINNNFINTNCMSLVQYDSNMNFARVALLLELLGRRNIRAMISLFPMWNQVFLNGRSSSTISQLNRYCHSNSIGDSDSNSSDSGDISKDSPSTGIIISECNDNGNSSTIFPVLSGGLPSIETFAGGDAAPVHIFNYHVKNGDVNIHNGDKIWMSHQEKKDPKGVKRGTRLKANETQGTKADVDKSKPTNVANKHKVVNKKSNARKTTGSELTKGNPSVSFNMRSDGKTIASSFRKYFSSNYTPSFFSKSLTNSEMSRLLKQAGKFQSGFIYPRYSQPQLIYTSFDMEQLVSILMDQIERYLHAANGWKSKGLALFDLYLNVDQTLGEGSIPTTASDRAQYALIGIHCMVRAILIAGAARSANLLAAAALRLGEAMSMNEEKNGNIESIRTMVKASNFKLESQLRDLVMQISKSHFDIQCLMSDHKLDDTINKNDCLKLRFLQILGEYFILLNSDTLSDHSIIFSSAEGIQPYMYNMLIQPDSNCDEDFLTLINSIYVSFNNYGLRKHSKTAINIGVGEAAPLILMDIQNILRYISRMKEQFVSGKVDSYYPPYRWLLQPIGGFKFPVPISKLGEFYTVQNVEIRNELLENMLLINQDLSKGDNQIQSLHSAPLFEESLFKLATLVNPLFDQSRPATHDMIELIKRSRSMDTSLIINPEVVNMKQLEDYNSSRDYLTTITNIIGSSKEGLRGTQQLDNSFNKMQYPLGPNGITITGVETNNEIAKNTEEIEGMHNPIKNDRKFEIRREDLILEPDEDWDEVDNNNKPATPRILMEKAVANIAKSEEDTFDNQISSVTSTVEPNTTTYQLRGLPEDITRESEGGVYECLDVELEAKTHPIITLLFGTPKPSSFDDAPQFNDLTAIIGMEEGVENKEQVTSEKGSEHNN